VLIFALIRLFCNLCNLFLKHTFGAGFVVKRISIPPVSYMSAIYSLFFVSFGLIKFRIMCSDGIIISQRSLIYCSAIYILDHSRYYKLIWMIDFAAGHIKCIFIV